MKRSIKYIAISLMGMAAGILSSCSHFDELNTDPTRMQESNPGVFLDPILYNVSKYNLSRYNGFTFHLMQSIVTTNSTGSTGWYNEGDASGDGTWTTYYRWLNNVAEMEQQAIALNEPDYLAIAKTLKGWMYSILVDSFGDIPMTEANRAKEQIFMPKFDTQTEVYRNIITQLDSANLLYTKEGALKYNTDGEMLYQNDLGKWKKFTNSLRLRVLLRGLTIPELNARSELARILQDPQKYPIFESNEDAAELAISGVYPQELPMVRPQDFTSYKVLSEFFINNLVAWEDPRLPLFAVKATNGNDKSYVGWPSGYNIQPSFNGSLPNRAIVIPPMHLMMMSYAEVEFILAELAQRGILPVADAAEHYRKGVEAAITRWGGEVPADYFSNPLTAYDGTLERIMLQKFYALFFCDYQQWFEHNRTGFPKMPVGDGVLEGRGMPRRFKYPAILQRNNRVNYSKAVERMGGDELDIKLIWQK